MIYELQKKELSHSRYEKIGHAAGDSKKKTSE